MAAQTRSLVGWWVSSRSARWPRALLGPLFLLLSLLNVGHGMHAKPTQVLNALAKDNTLCYGSGLANGRAESIFVGVSGQDQAHRGLLQFAPTLHAAPPGSVLRNVTLSLYVLQAGSTAPTQVSLHRVQQPWGEGTSQASGGECAPATADDATWSYTYYGNRTRWQTPGGDFDPSPLVNLTLTAANQFYNFSSPALSALVNDWLTGQQPNFGLLLKQQNESLPGLARKFASKDAADVNVQPRVLLSFLLVSPTSHPCACPCPTLTKLHPAQCPKGHPAAQLTALHASPRPQPRSRAPNRHRTARSANVIDRNLLLACVPWALCYLPPQVAIFFGNA
ncbi:uncharacterized protein MONBRDRAFT_6426 [Monosiga brevicollis MX1]|uniref:DNRLRE domain-containing protein n=1 Tax=Monosiga brevicollis TaxID=81824 RepID=A9UTU4_MONBE|nr:uncharacterized protein MONBRDRAFT_6426 [Monosiga brevicollis MX1]EDQ91554.1 predicted protein [Monosiga brevicollis MX1]|eukprot:XP_001743976.1 hypothetical protein [Monosiga brevicollis MX1]